MAGRYDGNSCNVNITAELGGLLLEVEKPARYVGGEFGILARDTDAVLRSLIAFPDLYEIGMGNQALRIIYNRMNSINGIVCDRAFAPAPDFEKLLRAKNIPLYGLDTGISLACLDLLMFTLGYELGLNGVLTMLDISRIPLHCEERIKNKPRSFTEEEADDPGEYPIVIAGGPAVSNPLPFSPFIDAFWIGEAEAGFFDLAGELAWLKKKGEGRAALLEKISSHPNVWVRGKEKARRAVFAGFSLAENTADVFPVPSMKIVHHHGVVEIMRGCPNGCRFCHAGFWYRPMRQKSREQVVSEARQMITKGGWREISLSSLSSGDYSGAEELVETLNRLFKSMHVSFQLPSLKVSSFSLALLEKISVTRKSGLTFAVETPYDMRQMAINKDVTRDSVAAILAEAKKSGWRTAKFYFMIGLPLPACGERSEEEEIVEFIINVAKRVRMHFNISVGIFVPKPHTPYQWASQLDSAAAAEKLEFIRARLKPMGHKVSVCDPLISRIEGLLSRGDESAGLLCEEAYRGGSRLDAWSEYIDKDKWRQLLEENSVFVNSILSEKERQSKPPWQGIDSGVTNEYLRQELEKSDNAQRTASCKEQCGVCGVCGNDVRVCENNEENAPASEFFADGSEKRNDNTGIADHVVNHIETQVNNEPVRKTDPAVYRVLFGFSKRGTAVFHGHLSLIEIFSMAFMRAGIPVIYTQGFNPLAKIEIASPLSTGVSADCEIAVADFSSQIPADIFSRTLNDNLPQGVRIEKAGGFHIPGGMKKYSLSSLLWGFAYAGDEKTDYVKAAEDKNYKQARLHGRLQGRLQASLQKDYPGLNRPAIFSLKRSAVLARDITGKGEWASYFDVYRHLYPEQ